MLFVKFGAEKANTPMILVDNKKSFVILVNYYYKLGQERGQNHPFWLRFRANDPSIFLFVSNCKTL